MINSTEDIKKFINDNSFNKDSDTAFDVNYAPTTPADWGVTVPTETGGGLDILIKKVSTNASQNIAYVSETGSDTVNEFEVGNPLKPFATIQAAINAVPSSNSIVKVLGGIYTDNIVISTVEGNAKTNFVLDLSGVTFNTIAAGTGFVVSNCINFTILLHGGIINGFVNLGNSTKASIEGGKIENLLTVSPCLNLGSGSEIIGVSIKNSGTQTISCSNQVLETRPFVSKCRISTTSLVSSHAAIFRARFIIFETCYIEGPIALSTENSADYCTLIDCTLVSTVSTTLKGENLVLNAVLKNCTIKSLATGQDTMSMSLNSINTRFYNCNFIAQRHCVDISAGIARLGDNTIFQDCNFFCDQDGVSGGKILNDAPNTDTGSTEFINCTYNDTWSTNAANAFDNNGLLKIGLLPPPL